MRRRPQTYDDDAPLSARSRSRSPNMATPLALSYPGHAARCNAVGAARRVDNFGRWRPKRGGVGYGTRPRSSLGRSDWWPSELHVTRVGGATNRDAGAADGRAGGQGHVVGLGGELRIAAGDVSRRQVIAEACAATYGGAGGIYHSRGHRVQKRLSRVARSHLKDDKIVLEADRLLWITNCAAADREIDADFIVIVGAEPRHREGVVGVPDIVLVDDAPTGAGRRQSFKAHIRAWSAGGVHPGVEREDILVLGRSSKYKLQAIGRAGDVAGEGGRQPINPIWSRRGVAHSLLNLVVEPDRGRVDHVAVV